MSEIRINGEPAPLRPEWRLIDLVEALGYAGRRVAVEVNGAIVPKGRYHDLPLVADDRVEIVVAVGGG
jgi:sulfur carrier protein